MGDAGIGRHVTIGRRVYPALQTSSRMALTWRRRMVSGWPVDRGRVGPVRRSGGCSETARWTSPRKSVRLTLPGTAQRRYETIWRTSGHSWRGCGRGSRSWCSASRWRAWGSRILGPERPWFGRSRRRRPRSSVPPDPDRRRADRPRHAALRPYRTRDRERPVPMVAHPRGSRYPGACRRGTRVVRVPAPGRVT
jgi:hypothetical protein